MASSYALDFDLGLQGVLSLVKEGIKEISTSQVESDAVTNDRVNGDVLSREQLNTVYSI